MFLQDCALKNYSTRFHLEVLEILLEHPSRHIQKVPWKIILQISGETSATSYGNSLKKIPMNSFTSSSEVYFLRGSFFCFLLLFF